MFSHPGRVVTKFQFSSLFRQAWSKGLSIENICAGFKKTGVYPFNPQAILKGYPQSVEQSKQQEDCSQSAGMTKQQEDGLQSAVKFSVEQLERYHERYANHYNVYTEHDYVAWLEEFHPESVPSIETMVGFETSDLDYDCSTYLAVSDSSASCSAESAPCPFSSNSTVSVPRPSSSISTVSAPHPSSNVSAAHPSSSNSTVSAPCPSSSISTVSAPHPSSIVSAAHPSSSISTVSAPHPSSTVSAPRPSSSNSTVSASYSSSTVSAPHSSSTVAAAHPSSSISTVSAPHPSSTVSAPRPSSSNSTMSAPHPSSTIHSVLSDILNLPNKTLAGRRKTKTVGLSGARVCNQHSSTTCVGGERT